MSGRTEETLTCWAMTLLLAGLALLIAGGAVSDGGRSGNNHYAPLPRGVVELAADSYIITSGATIPPGKLCVGTDNEDPSPIRAVMSLETTVPALRSALFLRCDQGQTWGDHGPRAISWGQGIKRVGASPFYLSFVGGLLVLGTAPALIGLVEYRRKRRRILVDAEVERSELREGFAKGEIDRAEFDAGLDRLYGLGLKPPSWP